jgi:hypothetical protein
MPKTNQDNRPRKEVGIKLLESISSSLLIMSYPAANKQDAQIRLTMEMEPNNAVRCIELPEISHLLNSIYGGASITHDSVYGDVRIRSPVETAHVTIRGEDDNELVLKQIPSFWKFDSADCSSPSLAIPVGYGTFSPFSGEVEWDGAMTAQASSE